MKVQAKLYIIFGSIAVVAALVILLNTASTVRMNVIDSQMFAEASEAETAYEISAALLVFDINARNFIFQPKEPGHFSEYNESRQQISTLLRQALLAAEDEDDRKTLVEINSIVESMVALVNANTSGQEAPEPGQSQSGVQAGQLPGEGQPSGQPAQPPGEGQTGEQPEQLPDGQAPSDPAGQGTSGFTPVPFEIVNSMDSDVTRMNNLAINYINRKETNLAASNDEAWFYGVLSFGVGLAALVAFLLVVVLAGLVIARQVNMPRLLLEDAAEAAANGTFDPASLESLVDRQDEIGHLGREFIAMTAAADQRYANLQAQVDDMRARLEQARR
jgi:hypothetical protein